ncbi:MAG: hypothetical protein JWR80_1727 [Bradyrhizobium sp.]|nr:hypothetical protein [Bradyrhizobium sp.]
MTSIATDPRFEDADQFYHRLVEATESVPEENQLDFSLRLILLLANQVGSAAVLGECIAEAARPFKKSESTQG